MGGVMAQRLDTEVLVIGGGATGTGVARDLAMRGFKTILVEKADLTHGTTGRYHGLLHSGGRYAVKDPQAARECIEENLLLRKIMPQCIEDTGGFFVLTPWDDPEYAPRFVQGCQNAGIPVEEVPISQMLREEPLLNPGITRCFRVPDASADSFVASDLNADSAVQYGATIKPYHVVRRLITEGPADAGAPAQRILGAVCYDRVHDQEVMIHADLVVNASGAWAGLIAGTAGIPLTIIGGKGVMVAMNHRIVNTVINRCKMPSDGDILVPAHTVSVIGTTDVKINDPDQVSIEPWEVHLCLEEGDKLVPGFKAMRMLRAWAGVRPLYQESAVSDTRDVTRAFVLLDHKSRDGVAGLVTITSGKWTTYRKMAEVTVDLVCQKLGVQRPCRTHLEPLPGASHGHHYLGGRLQAIEADKSYGHLVCECELATQDEVIHSIVERRARTIDDVRRDVRLGMGPCQGGFCTYRVAGLLHRLASQEPGDLSPKAEATNVALRDFLQERWKGLLPVLWGQQLRQERLDELIYQSVLNADHLPGADASPIGPEDYAPPSFKKPNEIQARSPEAQPVEVVGVPTSPGEPTLDVLVLGGGLAGLTAAWQAAGRRQKVRLITKGWGSLHWNAGCVDVLGYYPYSSRDALASPEAGLEALRRDHPEHPYTLLSLEQISAAIEAFQSLCADAGYPMQGSLSANWMLPSALGTLRPTCLAPESMTAGDLQREDPMLIVGFDQFPDFFPELIAANLSLLGKKVRGVTLDVPSLRSQRFVTGRVLATLFDQQELCREIARLIKLQIKSERRIGFPAVLGLKHPAKVKTLLEAELGLPVFEIPTLPPSIPGIRLHQILVAAVERAGGRVYDGMQAINASASGKTIHAVYTEAAARNAIHSAKTYVLASGGILGGGSRAEYDGGVRESIFDLPLNAPQSRESWFHAKFFSAEGHPIYRSGVRLGPDFRPQEAGGNLVYENLYVAGNAIGNCDAIRERSLDGIALATGYHVGNLPGQTSS